MDKKKWDEDGTIWVHGLPARSWRQVTAFLDGDAHDRSKVQVAVNGKLYDLRIANDD